MVPKVAAKGRSFKGAGLYYLHDKKAGTAERVAFTHTENLPTDNAELALRIMAYTAMRQGELKAASGAAMTGRKLTQSVYTYSLSWHPDEKPSQEQMIEAARETLAVLGLEKHEALFVAHNDEPHPHIHVIVNRVNPENGLAAKLSKDHLDLSKWAEDYERRHGKIFCEERVQNNAKRRRGEFARDRRSLNMAEFTRWRRERNKGLFAARQAEEANLSAFHKGQRAALYDEKEVRIAQRRQEIREAYRGKWRWIYQRQRSEALELESAQRHAFSRLVHWVRHRHEIPTPGILRGALEAVLGRHDYAGRMWERHEAEREQLAASQKAASREAIAQENERYRTELAILVKEQREEAGRIKDEHARESKALAEHIKQGGDIAEYLASLPPEKAAVMREEFRRRAERNIRRAKERREEERARSQGRERED